MKKVYPVIFTKTKKEVLVEVPDLEILTQGGDMAEAIAMARDAIGLKAISMQDAGEKLPASSSYESVNESGGTFAGEGKSVVSLVDIDVELYRRRMDQKMVRRNVTIPAWMDREATDLKINVSKCLQQALMQELKPNV